MTDWCYSIFNIFNLYPVSAIPYMLDYPDPPLGIFVPLLLDSSGTVTSDKFSLSNLTFKYIPQII